MVSVPAAVIRPYRDTDEPGWLRCRVLSFLDTQYYDDVRNRRAPLDEPSVALVAVLPSTGGQEQVVGILDVEIDGVSATIDTIAVHPDHARRGIASALLGTALPLLQEHGALTLDAWTREDVGSNAWYQRHGFVEQTRYLHVHKEWDDDSDGFTSPPGMSAPVRAFSHAPPEREAELRARYRRVYVCRQYLRPIDPDMPPGSASGLSTFATSAAVPADR